jgi:antitoxin HigA-1
MAKSRKTVAVPAGQILKTEFLEPMGVSAYALAKALNFPGIYEVVRGDRAVNTDTAIRLGKYFGLPAQFWLNLQNDYDLRIAEGCGIGRAVKPRNVGSGRELTGVSQGEQPADQPEAVPHRLSARFAMTEIK